MILFSQSSNGSLYFAIVFIVVATIVTIITLMKYGFEKALPFGVAFGTNLAAMTIFFFAREQANKAEQRAAVAEEQVKDVTDHLALAKADAMRTEVLLADAGKKASRAEQKAALAEKQSKDATDRLALAKADAKRTEVLLADAGKKASQAEQRAVVAEKQSKDAIDRLALAEAKRTELLRADAGTTRESSTISQPRPSDRQGTLVSTRQEPTVQSSPYGISYEEFRVHARNHDAVIVDGRDPIAYSLGHVPGAINIPGGERPPYRDRYLNDADPNQLILIYCNSESCHISDMLAERFRAEGFTNVRVYAPGWQVLSARMRDLR